MFRQSADISTTDSLNWVNTEMSMVLYPSNTYTLSCDILFTGAAATTGQAINLTNTASVSNPYIMYDTWSTATAPVGFSTNVFNTVLTGTGSGAAVIRPNKIIADFATTSGGNLTIRIRSEVATSATTLLRGSQCLLYNVSNLRTTPVKNASGTYPAQKRLITNVTTTSNTVYTPTELSFNGLTAGRSYTLNCDLVFAGQAATTGQAVNVSTTAGYSNAYIIYDTWSSATANVGFSATSFPAPMIGTGSGALILKPNKLIADFTATSGGTINLSIRSEVSGSFTTLMKGSMCLLYDNNGA